MQAGVTRFEIQEGQAGARLDHFVANSQKTGLRAARRAIADGRVFLNGKKGRPGERLRLGDKIEIRETCADAPARMPLLVAEDGDYRFFYKPAGMHTVALAGRENANLESFLPALADGADLALLQRLDYGTSGLVAAATCGAAANAWRGLERDGAITKRYLAALKGELLEEILVKSQLATSGGKRIRVKESEADPLGWTLLKPLWQGRLEYFDWPVTIAACEIKRGQRHQIRAHAACAGYPLAGDGLYGGGAGGYLLEHCRIDFGGRRVSYFAPDSPLRAALAAAFPEKGEDTPCI